jgi:hypothetical protein
VFFLETILAFFFFVVLITETFTAAPGDLEVPPQVLTDRVRRQLTSPVFLTHTLHSGVRSKCASSTVFVAALLTAVGTHTPGPVVFGTMLLSLVFVHFE